ncbi:MAG: AAA family ATPase [Thiohalophilus sp.]
MSDPQTPAWLTALQQSPAYPHPVERIELIETHISWVLLTGEYAYKLKKPLDLGFLDFSTLDKRHYYCREELRLNRRLAAPIYLDVLAVIDSAEGMVIGDPGEAEGTVIEYALKMRQFDPEQGFDKLLQQQQLTEQHLDQLARLIGEFHQQLPAAPAHSDYGSLEAIRHPCEENFRQIRQQAPQLADDPRLVELESWSEQQLTQREARFRQRHRDGFIRECHGDLHLRNIALWRNRVIAFDCIEFDPALRWIDTLNEIAFLIMDLDAHQAGGLGWYFLNRYLEQTGDYAGLDLLPFYRVYRAMVRAKVAAIELAQHAEATHQEELAHYLDQAMTTIRADSPALLITMGFSGSGKSTVTDQLLQSLGAVRLRSDVERERLFGRAPDEQGIGTGKYSTAASDRLYAHLREQSRHLLAAGYTVIVDAAFLQRARRAPFLALADECGVPLHILALEAEPAVLRQRIRQRQAAGGDASEADLAVLESQLQHHDPLDPAENHYVLRIDTRQPLDPVGLAATIRAAANSQ